MKKFMIEDSFWQVFPEAKIGIITCYGINNKIEKEDKYLDLIAKSEQKALSYLTEDNFIDNDIIKVWRQAFTKFKTKKGARSSIEALFKRVKNGNQIPTINPLVDLYNSISLNYALPCGGEDIDAIVGNIRLTKAEGTESFITLGSEESEIPYVDEIIYKDDEGAICRCWNWREAVRTMLKESTTNAFLCIELVDLKREAAFNEALEALKQLVIDNLGGQCKVEILDINTREVEL
ncbi:B3/4 domain-containing protein [Erysipelotrichaceae bacterium OttesenSCG-928-M19]|nr:B3/4 domain-containing protein [Erysipelotrichaceae bacterium OttesenSCG-928-M19]